MAIKLRVSVGSDRFHSQTVLPNDIIHPISISTPLFIGRVLIYIKHFTGITPEGKEPITTSSYFEGRSRKFAILIEGKFRRQEGADWKPYSGDEVLFGSDFEYLPESFPRGPFNLGMSIAKMVDPATFYSEHPPSGRPYIMSPYTACMNTFCAYPSPQSYSRAVLLRHHDEEHPHKDGEAVEVEGGLVPRSEMEGKTRKERPYWRFVGLKGDPRVDNFLSTHSHLLFTSSPPSSPIGTPLEPITSSLGTIPPRLARDRSPSPSASGTSTPQDAAGGDHHSKTGMRFWGAIPQSTHEDDTKEKEKEKKGSRGGRFSLATLKHALGADGEKEEVLHKGDLVMASDVLKRTEIGGGKDELESELERELGPWRFGEEGVDALEDTTSVFLDPSHVRSVAQRRKHFCAEGGKYRKDFTFDPDTVYTTSFFTNFCDLDTFDLKMGPLSLNIASHFKSMPIRYTLRSTRLVPSLDPNATEGALEEECFVTIAFEVVEC